MAEINKPADVSTVWANAGSSTAPANAKVNQGWVAEIPAYQYFNWLENKQDSFIAHVNQHGIAMWDLTTEYIGGKSYTMGSNGQIYKALLTSTNRNPTTSGNESYWTIAFETYGAAAAVQVQVTAQRADYNSLANIANLNAARLNLNVWSRQESDTRYAPIAGNSSQTFNVAPATADTHAIQKGQLDTLIAQATETVRGTARLATVSLAEEGLDDLTIITPLKGANTYLKRSGNLGNLGNVATARNNLGLGAAATKADTFFLQSSLNLSDLADASIARTNLGLTSTSTTPIANILLKADNLAGLTNTGTARNNLGLGGAAVKNVIGVPSDLDFSSLQAENGYTKLPNGLIMQWGAVFVAGFSAISVTYPLPFPNACFNMQGTYRGQTDNDGDSCYVVTAGKTSFVVGNIGRANVVQWFAIGN